MNMSYIKLLQQQIKELEIHIEQSSEKRENLEAELNKLKIAKFEEELREENNNSPQLLKG